MTREEAIAILEDIITTFRGDEEYKDWVEACSYAINLMDGKRSKSRYRHRTEGAEQ